MLVAFAGCTSFLQCFALNNPVTRLLSNVLTERDITCQKDIAHQFNDYRKLV